MNGERLMFEPISITDFKSRTGIEPDFVMHATKVVSLRDLVPGSISAVHVMRRDYLSKLLRSVTLEGDGEHRPYEHCQIELARIDPSHLVIGQTFIQRSKYQDILEKFGNHLNGDFCVTPGTVASSAMVMYGQTRTGEDAIAHYIPPIIEVSGDNLFLLDGIHRNYLAMRVGTTIESVLVKGVKAPPPCDVRTWSDIKVVNKKPPREKRFYNLQPPLFRNLKWIGVDG